jgi:hypothetical protein
MAAIKRLNARDSKLLQAAASKDGKPLYAIAFNIRGKDGQWHPHAVEYVHAHDAPTARNIVIRSFKGRQLDIIAAAPAIGFFVEDNHGEVLATG